MESNGKLAGILETVSSALTGKPDGTSVRSPNVEGRRRKVGCSADGRASNGTSDRGIIYRWSSFLGVETQASPPPDGCLSVGPSRRAPVSLPLRGWQIPIEHGRCPLYR